MAAVQQEAPFDFDALHARVCPDRHTLTDGQRDNKVYPTEIEVFQLLSILVSSGYEMTRTFQIPRGAAYNALIGCGLIRKNGTAWANGMPYQRYRVTPLGRMYLHWLRRRLFTPVVVKARADLDDLRPYCRRFHTAARWASVTAYQRDEQRNAARDELYREQCAEVQAQRYIGVGG